MLDLEAVKRVALVEAQRLTEKELAQQSKENVPGAVAFFVPDLLTPLFPRVDIIYQDPTDNLFKFSGGDGLSVGLMSAEKAGNAEQLSSVLGRCLSMQEVLEEGVPVIIFAVNPIRKQVKPGDPLAPVDAMPGSLLERYKERLTIVPITPEEYEENKLKIPAASYVLQNGMACYFISQINHPHEISSDKFDRFYGDEAKEFVKNLDNKLAEHGLKPLAEIAKSSVSKKTQTAHDNTGVQKDLSLS